MNILQALDELSKKRERIQYLSPAFTDKGLKAGLEDGETAHEWYKKSQKFLLDVEKAQIFYDVFSENTRRIHDFNSFELPFDCVTFGFKEPIVIKWVDLESEGQDVDTPLVAVTIQTMREYNSDDFIRVDGQMKMSKFTTQNNPQMKDTVAKDYIMFLWFNDMTMPGIDVGLSNQYLKFTVIKTQSIEYSQLLHTDHYPCRNKTLCGAYKVEEAMKQLHPEAAHFPYGNYKSWVCQEIWNRDSLMEMLFYIVNKINTLGMDAVKRKPKPKFSLPEWAPRLPFGWPYTKGNLPKDYYTCYLDSKRYRYDPDDLNLGMGTKHRYRYDVRRHPRIVGNKLVWVHPHQRGAGKYIPKIYKNSRTWYVDYVWFVAEKLSAIRVFEIMMVKAMRWLKERR